LSRANLVFEGQPKPVAWSDRSRYIGPANRKIPRVMRAEIEKLDEDIKRSVGLLRRHL